MENIIRQGDLKLYKTESSCDVILCCQGYRIMAHKLILAIASPVFRNLLLQDHTEPAVIILPDVRGNTMSMILDYIYSGSVVIYSNLVIDFLNTAELLQLNVDKKYLKQCRYENSTKQEEYISDNSVEMENYHLASQKTEAEPVSYAMGEARNRKRLKKMPNLISIRQLSTARFEQRRKMHNQVIPSPWCPRLSPILADPRIDRPQHLELQANSTPHIYTKEVNNNIESISTNYNEVCRYSVRKLRETSSTSSCNTPRSKQFQKVHHRDTNNSYSPHTTKAIEENSEHEDYDSYTPNDDLKQEYKKHLENIECGQNRLSKANTNTTDDLGETPEICCPCPNTALLETLEESKEIASRNHETNREKTLSHKSYKCQQCGKRFSQLRNFKYHRSIHEGTKEFAAKCEECGKVFNDRGYLSSHMKIHRDKKEYACPNCPKRFNQRVAFNMHLRIHTGIKPHKCSTCGKSFSRKMLLKQHQRVHTGEKPYSCTVCGKTFADRSNMSLHSRLHTGVKPYVCSLCPKSFTKKHHLKTHMNFHTGLKPYACGKCGVTFSQSSNMRTHYKKCILKNATTLSVTDVS